MALRLMLSVELLDPNVKYGWGVVGRYMSGGGDAQEILERIEHANITVRGGIIATPESRVTI
ncbi:unnamed protein product [Cercospora beticola]|nr:unnamed protein product [Cercospora beticola]